MLRQGVGAKLRNRHGDNFTFRVEFFALT
jgi:hypothetical protein